MTNIRIFLKTLPIVCLLLGVAWFVSLQLTKQRVQLEATSKIKNMESYTSPYVWDFKNFSNDIVQPFQQFWRKQEEHHIIVSQNNNPQLSLNFSGEVLNTFHHKELIINSPDELSGLLTIQVKDELSNDVFYYLKNIPLSGKSVVIKLDNIWSGIIGESKKTTDFHWSNSANKISSIVLQFRHLKPIKIKSIIIPYKPSVIKKSKFEISCDAKVLSNNKPHFNEFNTFILKQNCWYPSNYMWLKDHVQKTYPGSLLVIENSKLWLENSTHKVNKLYSNNPIINSVLYISVIVYLFIVLLIANKFNIQKNKTNQETWYRWLTKQLLFQGARKLIAPYPIVLNYLIVLIPTVVLLIVMSFFYLPNFNTFKLFPMYFLWALLQQFVLGYVLAQRVFYQQTQNRLLASLLAGAVFAILHMPSTVLMVATFIAGCFWAYAWLVFKRFIPLAISHSLLALMFYYLTNDNFLYSARVMHWFWT